jgi:hypothetical protein
MTTFLAYIWRLIVILTGFAMATISSCTVFLVAMVPAELGNAREAASWVEAAWDSAIALLYLSALAGLLIIAPVIILAILAEVFGWRGFLFHGAAGAIFGLGMALFVLTFSSDPAYLTFTACTAAGISGAWVYWLIAGRKAGLLFERIAAERTQ